MIDSMAKIIANRSPTYGSNVNISFSMAVYLKGSLPVVIVCNLFIWSIKCCRGLGLGYVKANTTLLWVG